MTNEEKIKEVLSKHKPLILEDDNDCYCHGSYISVPIVELMLKNISNWKDQQLKDYLEKKREYILHRSRNYEYADVCNSGDSVCEYRLKI